MSKELTAKQILAGLQKKLGNESALLVGQDSSVGVQAVCPTGLTVLDRWVLGCGGIPWGRLIEVYGPEGAGKTSLANMIMAGAQRDGAVAHLIEVEETWEPAWARSLGLNVDDLILSQPSYLDADPKKGAKDDNSAFALIEAALEVAKGTRIMFVLDSVAGIATRAEFLQGLTGNPAMAEAARIWSSGLRKLTRMLAEAQSTLLLVNQIRSKPGVMFGNPETTPGGNAIKFYCTQRLRMNHGKAMDAKLARGMGITASKNKLAPPMRHGDFKLKFEGKFDDRWSILNHAKEMGAIPEKGGKLSEALANLGWEAKVEGPDDADVEDEETEDASSGE